MRKKIPTNKGEVIDINKRMFKIENKINKRRSLKQHYFDALLV